MGCRGLTLNEFTDMDSTKTSRPFKCQHCSTSFSRTHDLRRHIKSLHTGQRPHTCPHCHLAFARSDALRRHLKLVLERGGIIPESNNSTSNSGESSMSRAELEKLVISVGNSTDSPDRQVPAEVDAAN